MAEPDELVDDGQEPLESSPPSEQMKSTTPDRRGDPVLSLEECAALTARLDMGPDERERALTDMELDEEQWLDLHAHWQGTIDEELERGVADSITSFDEAYVAQLEVLRGPIDSEDYARLERAAERGQTEQVRAALDIPAPGLVRVKRVWVRRLCADPTLRADFIDALECA